MFSKKWNFKFTISLPKTVTNIHTYIFQARDYCVLEAARRTARHPARNWCRLSSCSDRMPAEADRARRRRFMFLCFLATRGADSYKTKEDARYNCCSVPAVRPTFQVPLFGCVNADRRGQVRMRKVLRKSNLWRDQVKWRNDVIQNKYSVKCCTLWVFFCKE